MHVSLVIPTLNGMPLLERVLAAVDRQPGAAALERIAVDSGSTDGTVDCLKAAGFAVTAIDRSEFNHGATRDLAIGRSTGGVIVMLTQDAIPADDEWLPRLLESYSEPTVGAAYCRQLPREDCNPFIARRLREWSAGRDEPLVQDPATQLEFEQLAPMERLQRCAFDNVASSVRRSTWERHPFGHRRFGEDVAFGKRVILGGGSIVFQARSTVIHSHNRSPVAEGKRIYCDHQNLFDLFGVHLLPTWGDFRQNVRWARQHYGEIVTSLELPPHERDRLLGWTRGYARWSALGMYLGGNSARFRRGVTRPAAALIDWWMHRGI